MTNINAWSVLVNSPQELIGSQDQGQSFPQMIRNLLAPYYHVKSLTTVIITISLLLYIILVAPYPPFLKIPNFTVQKIILLPEHLKHFEFYRIFTAPFVYQDITALVLGILLLWCLGSFTEDAVGWKMFIVLTGLSGLIGHANNFTLPVFLLGCNFSVQIMKWADPNLPVLYRKVMLVVYFIALLIFLLLFVNYKRQQQFNFYASALYGFLLTSAVGRSQDANNISTFRKILASGTLGLYLLINCSLLIYIVFYGKTFI